MKWRYRFQVNAPAETLYEVAFVPERWFTFFKAYRGLESVDSNWPEEGSSIVFRYQVVALWVVSIKHTIVENQRGRSLRVHEEALSGLWIDNFRISFDPEDGATNVTLVTNQTSNSLWAGLFVLLAWPLNYLIAPPAMRRLKAIVESAKAT